MPPLCSTCSRPDVEEIDAALARRNATLEALADRFGLNKQALGRHRRNHLDRGRRARAVIAPPAAPAPSEDGDDRRTSGPSPEQLLAELDVTADALTASLARCEAIEDDRGIRETANALRGVNLARARLAGHLDRKPEPCPDCPEAASTPEFAQLVARLLRPLVRFPEAHAAVLAEVERLQATEVRA